MYAVVKLKKWLVLGLAAAVVMAGLAAGVGLASSSARVFKGVRLPVVMYHKVSESRADWNRYCISAAEFESDLQYIAAAGYTTIVIRDLIDYVEKGTPLPERPIMLTFDDGNIDNYTLVLPLLKKYNMKIVFAPYGKIVDACTADNDRNPHTAAVSWNDIAEMAQSGLVEVQNHSYDLHQGIGSKRKAGESMDAYTVRLTADTEKMQALIRQYAGAAPTAYVYPFGAFSKGELGILQGMGFSCTLGCYEVANDITRDPACLFDLGRFRRPHGVSSTVFLGQKLGVT
ncbi:MAG: polysaccharide deacetylase family protein [Oscillospiraceae bacterium]|nr:polysaccharide deacetylase family protein [Oscillospiraceae bacterium]